MRLFAASVVALVLAAVAAAAPSSPTITPACVVCPAGHDVAFTGSGFNDKTTYILNVSATNGYGGTLFSTGGQLSFVVHTALTPQTVDVRVFSKGGRGTYKLVAEETFLTQ